MMSSTMPSAEIIMLRVVRSFCSGNCSTAIDAYREETALVTCDGFDLGGRIAVERPARYSGRPTGAESLNPIRLPATCLKNPE